VPNIFIVLYILTTSLGLVILKLGSRSGLPISLAEGRLVFNLNAYTIGGLILYGISFMLYIYLISKFDLGYIIPLAAAFIYVLIFIASYFVFKEPFTLFKIMGITLIIGGIVLLGIKK
jgi:multidrug transporter EmrE-like cation transporter